MRLAIDGGRRGEGAAALGIALYRQSYATGGDSKYELICRKGVNLKCVDSAFQAEAMAMETGMELLISLVEGKFA